MGLRTDISLRGDGRVLALRPETVRQAMFQVLEHNGIGPRLLHPLEGVQLRAEGKPVLLLDWALRRNGAAEAKPLLSESETKLVERLLNRLLLGHDLALFAGEKRLHTGKEHRSPRGLQKILYTVKYGVLFELEAISRGLLWRQEAYDVCLEWPDRSLQIVRFLGVQPTREQLQLVFAHRFDLARQVRVSMNDFHVRRLFRIRRMMACTGYRLTNCQPLRQRILTAEEANPIAWWPRQDSRATRMPNRGRALDAYLQHLRKPPEWYCGCASCQLLAPPKKEAVVRLCSLRMNGECWLGVHDSTQPFEDCRPQPVNAGRRSRSHLSPFTVCDECGWNYIS